MSETNVLCIFCDVVLNLKTKFGVLLALTVKVMMNVLIIVMNNKYNVINSKVKIIKKYFTTYNNYFIKNYWK